MFEFYVIFVIFVIINFVLILFLPKINEWEDCEYYHTSMHFILVIGLISIIPICNIMVSLILVWVVLSSVSKHYGISKYLNSYPKYRK